MTFKEKRQTCDECPHVLFVCAKVSVCRYVHYPLESDHFSMIAAVSIISGAKSLVLYAESRRCSAAPSLVKLATSKDQKHLSYCTNSWRKGSTGWKQMARDCSYYKRMLGNNDVVAHCLIWLNSAPASGGKGWKVYNILHLKSRSRDRKR